jgi:uncharacterized protein (DUF885 family)
MNENEIRVQNKVKEVEKLVSKFKSQSEQIEVAQKNLDETSDFLESRFNDVIKSANDLIGRFGDVSTQNLESKKQLKASQAQLEKTQGYIEVCQRMVEEMKSPLEKQYDGLAQGVYAAVNLAEREVRDVKKLHQDSLVALNGAKEEFLESTASLKNVFDEENFKELCAKISELGQILEECKVMKDELLRMKSDIVEEIDKKVETEMSAIRAQQLENREFLERKFSELFEKLLSSTAVESPDAN